MKPWLFLFSAGLVILDGPLARTALSADTAPVWIAASEAEALSPLMIPASPVGWTDAGAPRYGILIQTAPQELIVAGHGIEASFSATMPGPPNTRIPRVDQGHFERARWVRDMSLNGDETAANSVVRIPPNPRNTFAAPDRPAILKVTLYRHD